VLDAVAGVISRHGAAGLTTNRIAARAGVSIGSLYQYFADKDAILAAVRERHEDQMAQLVERTLVALAEASLEDLVRGLIQATVQAHALAPALYGHLLTHLPAHSARGDGAEGRLEGALRLALASHSRELPRTFDVDRSLFVVSAMVESLAHAAALKRPSSVSLRAATEEVVSAVLGYLRGGESSRRARPARQRGLRSRVRHAVGTRRSGALV
jgi:AcrR family transcriptional regulator